MFQTAWTIMKRDIVLALKGGSGAVVGLIFCLAVVTVLPIAVGPDMALLSRIGPAMIWVAALLSTLFGLDRLFLAEDEDGSLDIIFTLDLPLTLFCVIKAAGHWVTSVLPVVLISPLFGLLLDIDAYAIALMCVSLIIGTPSLTFIGALGASFVLGLKKGVLLLPVLTLPFTIPVLIFGVGATERYMRGVDYQFPMTILAALSLFIVAVTPIAAAAALRVSRG